MNATVAQTVMEQFGQQRRAQVLAQVTQHEACGAAWSDQDIAALASWFHPLSESDVLRALWVRWLVNTGRLASLAEGN